MTPAQAIADLRARDATAYRKARAAFHAADAEYLAQSKMIAALGERQYRALERHLVRALKPHTVEWRRYGEPSEQENGSGDVNHAEWCTMAHLAGEVWPATKNGKGYSMQMRAHIPFSMTPRDGCEFLRMVALLKAAADAMKDAGL